MNWYKTNTGGIIGWLMVFVHDPLNTNYKGIHYVYSGYCTQSSVTVSVSACKVTSSTSTSCNATTTGTCWIGSVIDTSRGYSLTKGRCYDGNFTTGTPGATSRVFSTYSANQNTLANLFDNLRYYWRDSSGNIGWSFVL